MQRENRFLYEQLYSTLKDQIISGYIKPGHFLLPENELCKHYKLSRNSVRKALEELQKDGFVVKRPGLGTMVSHELVIPDTEQKVLHIVTPSPANFAAVGLPLVIQAFQQRYPNVEVKLLHLPSDNYSEAFRMSCEMGIQPDLVLISDLQLNEMSSAISFQNFSDDLSHELQGLYPKLVLPFQSEKGMFAAPITFTPFFIAYNPRLFENSNVRKPDIHWTLSDFLNTADKLTIQTEEIHEQIGFSMYPNISRWANLFLQNGLDPKKMNDISTIVHSALSILQDLIYHKKLATTYTELSKYGNPFICEKAAMILTNTFEMSGWNKEDIAFEPLYARLPFGESTSTLLQANLLMIPTISNNANLALDFIRMALDPAAQSMMSINTQFLSVREDVNTALHDPKTLDTLNIDTSHIENNFFLHELFSESVMEELSSEMHLFWLGLESAASLTQKFEKIISDTP